MDKYKFKREKIGPLEFVSICTERGINVVGIYFADLPPEVQASLGATPVSYTHLTLPTILRV